jgi:dipeptidyl aminopeptidase/acylaminoacyl peptidase
MLRLSLLPLLFLLFSPSPLQARSPFTFEDMMALKRVSDPQASPDSKWVLFSVGEVNLEANKRTSHLWIVPVAGGESRQITSDPAGETRGRWSPDGKHFLYVSSRGGGSQVWVADFDGEKGTVIGTHRRVTSISTEADGALWSPDGKHILFVSSVNHDCPDDACNKARNDEKAKSPVKAMIFTRLFFRHWNQYTDGKRNHIFVQPVEMDGTPAGTARDLTPGDYDSPVFSLGGSDLYAFSPDGQEICFTSNHDPQPAISTNNDLWIVPVSGGSAKNITADNPASDSMPRYSPNGMWIAYLAQTRAGYESDRFRLMLYWRKSGRSINLNEDLDRWISGIAWAPGLDGSYIYLIAEDRGEMLIYSTNVIDPVSSFFPYGVPCNKLVGGSNGDLVSTPDNNALIFIHSTAQVPNEVYSIPGIYSTIPYCGGDKALIDKKSGKISYSKMCRPNPKALTHLNTSVLSENQMQPLERFHFTGAEKTEVEGFLVKPPNFDPQKKYPVKFLVHGGPQGAWGDSWSYRWNPQLFAASGYVVVMINPRGSTGYGQQFIDDINGDWGGRVFKDLMLGLDYVENTYPFIDKDRECALGASYGGYMMNWMLGHTTRFKCFVSHDGMFNAESAWGSTEELWFNEWEFKGTPWTNRKLYQTWSPHM